MGRVGLFCSLKKKIEDYLANFFRVTSKFKYYSYFGCKF